MPNSEAARYCSVLPHDFINISHSPATSEDGINQCHQLESSSLIFLFLMAKKKKKSPKRDFRGTLQW